MAKKITDPKSMSDILSMIEQMRDELDRYLTYEIDMDDLDFWLDAASYLNLRSQTLEIETRAAINHAKAIMAKRSKIRRVK